MKMRFDFTNIYYTKLKVYEGEKKLNVGKKLLKIIKNTSGIQNMSMVSMIYYDLS